MCNDAQMKRYNMHINKHRDYILKQVVTKNQRKGMKINTLRDVCWFLELF